MSGLHPHSIHTRLRPIITVLAIASGTLAATATTAPIAEATTPGIVWSSPQPIDASASQLASVSCARASASCVAVDRTGHSLVFNGTVWSAPTAAGPGTDAFFRLVSCGTPSFCAAAQIGSDISTTANGVTWSSPTQVSGADAVVGLSCTSASFCITGARDGTSNVYNGTSWSPTQTGGPWFVSCAGRFCAGVDLGGNAYTFNGTTWSAPVDIDGTTGLDAVSCTSPSFCVAGDDIGRLLIYNGASWGVPTPVFQGTYVSSISCPTAVFCVATSGGSNVSVFNGSTWTAPSDIDPGGGGATEVDCPTSSFCMAVDASGNAMMATAQVAATLPGAPTGVSASPSDGEASVSWTAPSSTGGSSITGYDVQYSSNSGTSWTSASSTFQTSAATSELVTGLTDGASYLFRVAAINSVGTGPYSAPSSAVTVGAVPGAPTGVTATAGNGQATVSWTAPATTGGSGIIGYDVQYSSNSGGSWASASTSFHASAATTQVVTGLTNGTPYTFRVAAINALGTGAYSQPSAAVTPAAAPGAPTGVVATAGDAQATVSWTPPSVTGGSPITGYSLEQSSDGGATWLAAEARVDSAHDAPATTQTIDGLINGTSYQFRIAALNAAGIGAYSTPSAPVTPHGDSTKLTIGGPRMVSAGNAIILTTHLSDTTNPGPVGEATVNLYARTAGLGWSLLRGVATAANGAGRVRLSPRVSTSYEWRYAGDTLHSGSTSPVLSLVVRPRISASLSRRTAPARSDVAIYGVVEPEVAGEAVVLQRLTHGSWNNIGVRGTTRGQRLPNGRVAVGYVLRVPTARVGNYTYRVFCPASASNASGASGALALHIS